MQKVEGSSPFSRLKKARKCQPFARVLSRTRAPSAAAHWTIACCMAQSAAAARVETPILA
jgi:hypothetical protein